MPSESASAERAVCLFIPHLAIGGSEGQLHLLAKHLCTEGFRPIVATMEARDGLGDRFRADGLDVRILDRRSAMGLEVAGALRSLVRTERVAIIHAWLWAANWRAALSRVFMPSVPVILSVRSMEDDLGRVHDLGYRILARIAAAVIVNSAAVARRHARRSGLAADRYRIIPNGIDVDRLEDEASEVAADLPDLAGAPVIGYVGRLAERKRVDTLARIAPAVLEADPRARFLVIGDGPARRTLEDECARRGVIGRFTLLGARDRVGRYLRLMDVVVNPGYGEGASNAILEAMALGRPVVAYAEGGNVDTIRDGENGFMVAEGDERALGERVARLIARPDEARVVGDRARAFICREHAVAAMVRRTAEVYREALRS